MTIANPDVDPLITAKNAIELHQSCMWAGMMQDLVDELEAARAEIVELEGQIAEAMELIESS